MIEISADAFKYIISRLVDNALTAKQELDDDPGNSFYEGKTMAYYEVLDTLKNELEVREQDLKEYGLDMDLEKSLI